MQNRHPYKYAIIRVVPRVEREEFFNVGVILFCKRQKFLDIKYQINEAKLNVFSPEVSLEQLNANLNAWKLVSVGNPSGGSIGTLELSERFGWLTACRSTIIQSSITHSGLCSDPEKELEAIFEKYVL